MASLHFISSKGRSTPKLCKCFSHLLPKTPSTSSPLNSALASLLRLHLDGRAWKFRRTLAPSTIGKPGYVSFLPSEEFYALVNPRLLLWEVARPRSVPVGSSGSTGIKLPNGLLKYAKETLGRRS